MKIKIVRNISLALVVLCLSCNTAHSKKDAGNADADAPQSPALAQTSETKGATYKYDLEHPQKKWELPDALMEISGNTWIDKDHLLVIEDLHPNLYLLRLDDKAVIEKTVVFEDQNKEKIDIEDVTMINNTVYALWSHGTIFKIEDWKSKPVVNRIKTFLKKENNTEGICYDPVSGNLLVACKDASDVADEKKSAKAIYEFDVKNDKLKGDPLLLVHRSDFKKINGDKVNFFPSAIAVHPVTHHIYMLSTKDNKCMAEYDRDGTLVSFQFISSDLMEQPEGLCFAPDGTLYISSEGKKGKKPMLFRYGVIK